MSAAGKAAAVSESLGTGRSETVLNADGFACSVSFGASHNAPIILREPVDPSQLLISTFLEVILRILRIEVGVQ